MTQHSSPLDTVLSALSPLFGDRLSTEQAIRDQHTAVESWLPPAAPDAVVMAHSTEEVAEVLKLCHAHGVPVVPFGAGSSIEGQVNAPHGGISLDLSSMDRVLAVHADDMDCTVQCGVIRQRLNEDLRASGLFFPVDLGAHATLGGMAATRASGTTTVRYGSMKDLVLGLTVVLPDGRIVKTGGRARKSAAGYDLTHLFVGSEGTLGIITELTLRLAGIPEATSTLMCSFDDIGTATAAVVTALQFGLCLNRIELADAVQMAAINAYGNSDLPEAPTLWIELAGSEATVVHDSEVLQDLIRDAGATRLEHAKDAEAAAALWRVRHSALYAARALRPGIKGLSTDVCVPVSALPACIEGIGKVVATTSLKAPLIGHVGDGNFHMVLLFDPDNPEETAQGRRINSALIELALSLGGTSTGEHGVGLGKKAYMDAEHGAALDLMRQLKLCIDPANIMNPGKIFAGSMQSLSWHQVERGDPRRGRRDRAVSRCGQRRTARRPGRRHRHDRRPDHHRQRVRRPHRRRLPHGSPPRRSRGHDLPQLRPARIRRAGFGRACHQGAVQRRLDLSAGRYDPRHDGRGAARADLFVAQQSRGSGDF